MGSLPNLHALCHLPDTHEPFNPSPLKNYVSTRFDNVPQTFNPAGFNHQPVKHVRSVDCSIYVGASGDGGGSGGGGSGGGGSGDGGGSGGAGSGGCSAIGVASGSGMPERKRREHRAYHTLDRKFTVVNYRVHQKLRAYEARLNTISPASSRSTRSSLTIHHHPVGVSTGNVHHRDSMSSSAGTSSVRRLIGVVRSTPSQFGPVYSRRVIHRNWAALCLSNALLTSAIVPLLGLQSSISSWWWPPGTWPPMSSQWYYLSTDIGSLLLSSLFAIGSLSSLFVIVVIKRLGTNTTINVGYGCAFLFFTAHLYPKLYTLIPSYIIMGISLGPLTCAKVTALMALASKYSCVLSDEEEDEIEHVDEANRKDAVVHKLARWMQSTQDCGLVLGNLLTGMVMLYTWSISQDVHNTNAAIDSMYDLDELGERICGAAACPVGFNFHPSSLDLSSNSSDRSSLVLSCKSCTFLASVFIGFGVMGWIVVALFTDRLIVYQDFSENISIAKSYKIMANTFRDPHLQLVVPLALYIGLTQGFMYADFTKSYVVCSLDLYNVTWVFVALGVLQCISGCTVSLVLQQIKRLYVISVGFTFHSCLILVLLRWKPTGDDPALLYVIGAVWGVCNSIWECLTFSLIIAIYPDSWQPAIAHHYFFRYLGLALAFSIHGAFCNHIKLYILSVVLLLSAVSYIVLEWRLAQGPKNNLYSQRRDLSATS